MIRSAWPDDPDWVIPARLLADRARDKERLARFEAASNTQTQRLVDSEAMVLALEVDIGILHRRLARFEAALALTPEQVAEQEGMDLTERITGEGHTTRVAITDTLRCLRRVAQGEAQP